MDTMFSPAEEKNKNIGRVVSTIVHIILIALMFYQFMEYQNPPPGQEGVMVSFGEPELGMNDEPADVGGEPEVAEVIKDEPEEETVEEIVEEVPEVVEPPKEVVEPVVEKVDPAKLLAAKEAKERALQRDIEKKKKQKELADAKKKADAEAAKKRAAAKKARLAEEARKKAAQEKADREAAEAAKAKKAAEDAGKLFGGGGNGGGKLGGGEPGDGGQSDGKPDGSALDGLGTGRVGGGLGNRGGRGPKLTDRSQKQGQVIVKVCVNDKGKVVSQKATQRGSTIWDLSLNKKVEANAAKWTFKPGELDKQCGTITFTFKLQ